MAAVEISDSNNRREDFEGTPSFTSIGGGPGAGKELVTFIQGAAAGSRKATAATAIGFWVNIGTTVDMTQNNDDNVWLCKFFVSDYLDINNLGLRVRVGSDTSNYHEWLLHDDGTQGDNGEFAYPVFESWRVIPINVNVTAWRDFVGGTPSLTAVDEFAITVALAVGAAKSENLFLDAIDLGDGLYLVGGDGGDADGVFTDYLTDDEGTQTAGRFGHVTSKEGILYVFGKLVQGRTAGGSVTATVFKDSNGTMVFPGGRVGAGWNLLESDLGNASSEVVLADYTFVGRGQDDHKVFFDTITEVDPTPDEITVAGGHGYNTGNAVLYSKEGGTDAIGLTDATEYFVQVFTLTTFKLHTTRQNALTGKTPFPLSDGSGGESHSFTRQPDVRPDRTFTGTSGVGTETGDVYNGFRLITMTSVVAFTNCKFLNCGSLLMAQGTLDGCTISLATTNPGEAFVNTPDLSDISNCSFAHSSGHAVEITATGTFAYNDNTDTGYWVHDGDAGDGATFHTQTGIDPGTDILTTDEIHGFATGDEVYYEDHGQTDSVGLTDGARVFVRAVSTTTLSFHRSKENATANTNLIALSDGAAGQTQNLYSGHATIVNTSGGAVTINVGGTGSTPTVRNVGAASATVQNTKTLTVTVKEPGGNAVEGARVRIEEDPGGTLISEGTTNASGVYQDTGYVFGGDQAVKIIVRLKSFRFFSTTGTIDTNGLTVGVNFLPNPTVNLP